MLWKWLSPLSLLDWGVTAGQATRALAMLVAPTAGRVPLFCDHQFSFRHEARHRSAGTMGYRTSYLS